MLFEGDEKDDINNITRFFKKLWIDASQDLSLDIDIISKLFLTQLSLFENIKLTNTINSLINNIFKY